MSNHKYAVIGLGLFGKAIAITLSRRGAEVIAIDINEEIIQDIKDEVANAVSFDATDMKALKAQTTTPSTIIIVCTAK